MCAMFSYPRPIIKYPKYKLGRLSAEQLQFVASHVAVFVDDVAAVRSYTEEQ